MGYSIPSDFVRIFSPTLLKKKNGNLNNIIDEDAGKECVKRSALKESCRI